MPERAERAAFIVHGVVTLAAAVVLAVLPAAIPSTVGITIGTDAYLLSFFLAAAELGIGLLSLGAARLRDRAAIRLVAASFAAFHGATAVLEVLYMVLVGTSPVLLANTAVRVVATALFVLIARRS